MQRKIENFFEGLFNIFIYMPYLFSVPTLVRTLFSPWKNIINHEKTVGFSLSSIVSGIMFNLISRSIGAVMRSCLLLAFLFLEGIYILAVPVIIIGFFILLPLLVFLDSTKPSDKQRYDSYRADFIASHMLEKENLSLVEKWFDTTYRGTYIHPPWWKLESLFSSSPLARDWTMGYTPYLDQYAENLSSDAYLTAVPQVVGREAELKRLEALLSRSEEANAVIVGEEGIGKDTIISAFARRIYEGRTNSLLNYKRLLRVNMEKIAAEHNDQKQRETFFEDLLHEASDAKSVILVIEHLDRYLSSDASHIDLSGPIEKYAKRTTLQIIGTTTPFQYEKFIYAHPQINQLFTRIDIPELDQAQTLSVLQNLTASFEHRYRVTIPYETLSAIVDKSDFYISNVPFPEKAIQLLDTACAQATQNNVAVLTPQLIADLISQKTHAPTTLDHATKKMLLEVEAHLKQKVVAQDDAVHELSSALRSAYVLLGKRRKPLASFMFLGPTGTGKTETAKALAGLFFKSDKQLIRFDMSSFQAREDIPKLIGSSSTGDPGLLTGAIRDNPYGVLLLDELEKAHKDLLNIFLTVLDEGYFTDGTGHRVDCKNLMIIATSNAGAHYIFETLEKKGTPPTSPELMNYLIEQNIYTPEFLNRFDGVIVYKPLSQEALLAIAHHFFEGIAAGYKSSQKLTVTVSDDLLKKLIARSYHPEYGARNMQRVIQQEIEDKVAQMILSESAQPGQTINLT